MAELDFDNKVLRITFVQGFTGVTDTFTNVVYVRKGDGTAYTGAEAAAMATDLAAWWDAEYAPNVCDDVTLIKVEAKLLDGVNSAQVEVNSAAGGDIITAPLPLSISYAIKKITGLVGRRHRGRWFVGGLAEADVDDAGLVSVARSNALIGALDDLATEVGAPATAPASDYGFVSRAETPPVFRQVGQHAVADRLVDIQRRRLS